MTLHANRTLQEDFEQKAARQSSSQLQAPTAFRLTLLDVACTGSATHSSRFTAEEGETWCAPLRNKPLSKLLDGVGLCSPKIAERRGEVAALRVQSKNVSCGVPDTRGPPNNPPNAPPRGPPKYDGPCRADKGQNPVGWPVFRYWNIPVKCISPRRRPTHPRVRQPRRSEAASAATW